AEVALLKAETVAVKLGETGRLRRGRVALSLVELYTAQQRHVEGKHYYELATQIIKAEFDANQGLHDITWLNLAIAHKGIGLYEDAERFLLSALEANEKNASSPDVLPAIQIELADVYAMFRRYGASTSFLGKAQLSLRNIEGRSD